MEGRGLFFLMVMRKMRALVQVYLTIIAQSKIRIADFGDRRSALRNYCW